MKPHAMRTTLPQYLVALASFHAAAFPVPMASGQTCSWTQMFPSDTPSKRYGHEMAYDSARGLILLFGGNLGCCPDIISRELWGWDGATWSLLANSGPAPGYGHEMAYDSARGVLVVYGGWGTGWSTDTWEWDGSNWTQKFPATNPGPRGLPSMAYDSARGRVVLFGGSSGPAGGFAVLNDVWEWDGANWTERPAPTSPPPRSAHGLAYDAQRDRMVMFGGHDDTGQFFNDTWEWEGVTGTWTQQFPPKSPSARELGELVYDSMRSRTLLSGGRHNTNGDTWVWDGSTWTMLLPNGPGSCGWHAVAYDEARDRFVLFEAGVICGDPKEPSDTWEFAGPCPWDLSGDGDVGPFDLALLLGVWGPCPEPCEPGDPPATCAEDLDGNCNVGPFDLALLLGYWGPCP